MYRTLEVTSPLPSSRLPILQGGTFAFLAPSSAMLSLPAWKCPEWTLNASLVNTSSPEFVEEWQKRIREVTGRRGEGEERGTPEVMHVLRIHTQLAIGQDARLEALPESSQAWTCLQGAGNRVSVGVVLGREIFQIRKFQRKISGFHNEGNNMGDVQERGWGCWGEWDRAKANFLGSAFTDFTGGKPHHFMSPMSSWEAELQGELCINSSSIIVSSAGVAKGKEAHPSQG